MFIVKMIRSRSIVSVRDNSGLIKARCFHVIGKNVGTVGSRIITSAKKIESKTEWSRGDVVRGIIVRVKKNLLRSTGFVFKGSMNGMLVTNKKWEPIGTRVNGTLPKELRILGHMKVIAMANMIL